MSYRKEAKECFRCRNADVFYSKVALRIYAVCPNPKCFEPHFKAKKS